MVVGTLLLWLMTAFVVIVFAVIMRFLGEWEKKIFEYVKRNQGIDLTPLNREQ